MSQTRELVGKATARARHFPLSPSPSQPVSKRPVADRYSDPSRLYSSKTAAMSTSARRASSGGRASSVRAGRVATVALDLAVACDSNAQDNPG